MAGASRAHNLIVANIVREAGNALKGRACEVYPSDMRVLVEATGLFTYPDITIICGEPRFDDALRDTLVNPTLVVEVLSEPTEADDRGVKAGHYRQIPSLREYVLIATSRPSVERLVRDSHGVWSLREQTNPNGEVHFESVDITLSMPEIYRHIQFESPGPVVRPLGEPGQASAE